MEEKDNKVWYVIAVQVRSLWGEGHRLKKMSGASISDNNYEFKNGSVFYMTDGNDIVTSDVNTLRGDVFSGNRKVINTNVTRKGLRVSGKTVILGVDNEFKGYKENKVFYSINNKNEFIDVPEIIEYKPDERRIDTVRAVKINPSVIEAASNKANALMESELASDELSMDDILGVTDKEIIDTYTGVPGCPKCGGKGYYIGELGIKIQCDCMYKKDTRIAEVKQLNTVNTITGVDDNLLISKGIIREGREGDDFDRARTLKFIDVLKVMFPECISVDRLVNEYLDEMDKIIIGLRAGKLPNISYFFSAHKGFGKETFVNTCNRLAFAHNMKVVPYLSLLELFEKRSDYLGEIIDRTKMISENEYTWADFVRADILFCYVASSTPNSRYNTSEIEDTVLTELNVLETLLKLRSKKNRPTIVMSERRMLAFNKTRYIKSSFLLDIYAPDSRFASYGRMAEFDAPFGYGSKSK